MDDAKSTPAPPWLAVILTGIGFLALALGSLVLPLNSGEVAPIWVANAPVLGVILHYKLRSWPAFALVVLLGGLIANLAADISLAVTLGFSFANLLEIFSAAFLLRLLWPSAPQLSDIADLLKILAISVLVAPAGSATLGAATVALLQNGDFGTVWKVWWQGDAMGMLALLPVILSFSQNRWRELWRQQRWEWLGFTAVMLVVITITLEYLRFPFIVLPLPLLIAALRLNLLGVTLLAAVTVTLVTALGVMGFAVALPEGAEFLRGSLHLATSASVLLPLCISVQMEYQKRNLLQLQESEQRFRNAMEHSAIGMALVSLEGHWLKVNQAICQITGYARQELLNLSFQDITHPEDLDTDLHLLNQLLLGQRQSYRMEKRYIRRDGREIWVLLAVSMVRDQEGLPLYFIAQIEDIDSRRRAQMALTESEARWKFALEGGGQGVWDWQVATNEVFYSRGWQTLLGLEGKNITRNIDEWSHRVHPDDLEFAQRQLSALGKGKTETCEFEHRVKRTDGEYAWLLVRGKIIQRDTTGRVQRVIGTLTDITYRKQAEDDLLRMTMRLTLALDAGGIGVWEWHPKENRLIWDQRMCQIYGFSPDQTPKTPQEWWQYLHPEDLKKLQPELRAALTQNNTLEAEFRILPPDGVIRYIRMLAKIIRNADGSARQIIGTSWNVTESRLLAESLYEEKERLKVTLHSIGDAVICTDADRMITFMNPIAEQITGWNIDVARGKPLASIFNIVDDAGNPVASPVDLCLAHQRIHYLQDDVSLISRSGKRFHIQDSAAPIRSANGELIGAVLVFQDVTLARNMQRELVHSASHDALTNLPNRTEFERRLQKAINSAHSEHLNHALCFIDLDRFKIVNDTAGHAAGDALLKNLSQILKNKVRSDDLLARLGGDEFALLLYRCPEGRARKLCEQLIATIRGLGFQWEGRVYDIGASIGIAMIEPNAPNLSELLSRADVACYAAKTAGRNRVELYTEDESQAHIHRRDMLQATGLKQALANDRFVLFAQEIRPLSPKPGSAPHIELLLRLRDDEGELLPPGAFIPAAERYNLMGEVDRWVVRTALMHYGEQLAAVPGLTVAINLSANSFNDAGLLQFMLETLQESALPANQVRLELTETALINHLAQATEILERMREVGCRISLDDFGSGLSSFHYLKQFPVDFLKIDGGFIRNLQPASVDRAIIESMHDIARKIGAQTIAECVENQDALRILQDIGIDYAQGYALGSPKPLEDILKLLQHRTRPKLNLVQGPG